MNSLANCNKLGNRVFWKSVHLTILSLLAYFFLPPGTAKAASLLDVPPLLARQTASSITVNVFTSKKPLLCYVTYWQENANGKNGCLKTREKEIDAQSNGEINLTGLKPDTRYN
jgi:hypothetical protein